MRTVTVLGSTGSIGTQAAQIVGAAPGRFDVRAIAAGGSDLAALAAQAVQLDVEVVGAATGTVQQLREAVRDAARAAGRPEVRPEVLVGPDAATELAGYGSDVVLNGITGSIGLRPTLAALACGSTLALANKESLVVGGPLVTAAAAPGQVVPVDSEHSAIAQCLRAGTAGEVHTLILTASGGPFRGRSRAELGDVEPRQALVHNFSMGRMNTTNSATLVNKGLEVIEAQLLFGIPFERIEVVIHPQQMIHSMVEFVDGSTMAQCGPPSMLVPIALGLAWPDRVPDAGPRIDWTRSQSWEFEPLDDDAFPSVALARQVGAAGSTYPAVYNAANEVAVDAFHDGQVPFLAIVDTVRRVVDEYPGPPSNDPAALSVEEVLRAESWARSHARQVLGLAPTAHTDGDLER